MVGFCDEVWWSREALPAMHTFTPVDAPLHLIERTVPDADPTPKALACYGIVFRQQDHPLCQRDEMWLRFVLDRPVSDITIQYLEWVCERVQQRGKTALVLVWDNASWHTSKAVRSWLRTHNQHVKQHQKGVRLIVCFLPSKSPWLNPIEPRWVHAKRAIVEPASLLTTDTLCQRVSSYFHCTLLPPLAISTHVS